MSQPIDPRPATPADIDALLAMQKDYYREDGYAFRPTEARSAWLGLLDNAEVGRAWVGEDEAAVVGYVVAAFGYCLEYLGRDAFVDELYVAPAWRGRGLGSRLLAAAEAGCVVAGVRILHLEVEPDKHPTIAMYRRHGFTTKSRVSMSKPLA